MAASPESPRRLASLDALRGFDMVWIVGGRGVLEALFVWTGWSFLGTLSAQMRHPEWDGFTAWDLVFPLFLFLAGVSFMLSLERRRARGETDARIRIHALQRGLLLVAVGVLYNVGPSLDFSDVRYASVLGRIGLAWMFAAFIALRCGLRGQVLWIAGLLLGYWAALTLVPVPGQAAPSLEPGRTLTDWLDRALLPGRLHRGVRDPEGLLATVPAIATALSGMLAGRGLRAEGGIGRRAGILILAGLACLALGGLWDRWLPINKNLWSSSFTVWTSGWSLLLLGVFHALFDGSVLRRSAWVLAVVGANALAAYLAARFVPFGDAARFLLGAPSSAAGAFAVALLALTLLWLALWVLYRRRWFLKL